MRSLLVLAVLLFSISFYLPAQAGIMQPPLWQPDFGDALVGLDGCDAEEQAIDFPFLIPFNGSLFNNALVGCNGCIQLGGFGTEMNIVDGYWREMEIFLSDSDPDNPLICPINTDWDAGTNGTVFYNNSGDPLIFTWDGIGTNDSPTTMSSFQLLLYQDGRIVFNFNGILGPGEDLIEDLDQGIVVGITPSDFPYEGQDFVPGDPGPVNLNQGPFTFGSTVYERWCFDEADSCGVSGQDEELPGPINTAFDLDFWSICFIPNDDGFSVTSAFEGETEFECEVEVIVTEVPTLSEWGLIAMAGVLGIVGFMVMRRRKVTV